MISQTISHYRMVGKLGDGAMGVVYKADAVTLQIDSAANKGLLLGGDDYPSK